MAKEYQMSTRGTECLEEICWIKIQPYSTLFMAFLDMMDKQQQFMMVLPWREREMDFDDQVTISFLIW